MPKRFKALTLVLPDSLRRKSLRSFTINLNPSTSIIYVICAVILTGHITIKNVVESKRECSDSELRLKKTSGTYKEFGNSFYKVWSENFINYTAAMVSLFATTSSELDAALFTFYDNILQLAQVHEWQYAVLPLAIEVYPHIISLHLSDPTKCIIPPHFQ